MQESHDGRQQMQHTTCIPLVHVLPASTGTSCGRLVHVGVPSTGRRGTSSEAETVTQEYDCRSLTPKSDFVSRLVYLNEQETDSGKVTEELLMSNAALHA